MKQKIILDKKNRIKIIKNFLIQPYFKELQLRLLGRFTGWFYQPHSLYDQKDGCFNFTHTIYFEEQWTGADHINNLVRPMIWFVQEHIEFKTLSRIKANLTTNQQKPVLHTPHRDMDWDNAEKNKVAIYHVNTCNGFTQVGNRKITNEENQLIIFDNVKHCYATATDVPARVVINFNFIV
jgi:hypothetical protein